MVLGLSLCEWREREIVQPSIGHGFEGQEVLLIWQLFGKTYLDHRCFCGGDGDLLRAVCRQTFTVLVEALEIMADVKKEESAKGYRESSHH